MPMLFQYRKRYDSARNMVLAFEAAFAATFQYRKRYDSARNDAGKFTEQSVRVVSIP